MAVAASFRRVSTLFPSVVLTEISLTLLTAMVEARRTPFLSICVLTPCSTASLTSFSISPASTTTDVVPSPTSASWDRAMSVSIRAAGWTMSSSYEGWSENSADIRSIPPHTFMTVAPSLVIVCLPLASTINKSPPYGPSVLLIVACTARQALIFDITCPFPCD